MDKYVYDLRTYKKENSTRMWLQVLAMEVWGDSESIWYCDEGFKEYCAEVGGLDALKQQKIFSIEIEFRALLAVLYKASKKFILRKTFKAYMDEEGEGFPVSELTKIKKNIRYC